MSFFIDLTAFALQKHPILTARWTDKKYIEKDNKKNVYTE
jgi:hypothetical protein